MEDCVDFDFSALYQQYWERIFKQIIRILPDEDEVADVVQQTFVDLWEIRQKLPEIQNLSSFIFVMARNNAFKRLKRLMRSEAYMLSYSAPATQADLVLEEWLQYKELHQLLHLEIDRLPTKMKEMFVLSRYEGLSYTEIAGKLGKSDKTVKKQVSNAIKILKLRLNLKYSLPFLVFLLF
ncbi:sigma-70 family RNA polymerase sigma factor [Sphingobacterium sp.]|uniref:sigma-70 family RNA polymerase sigma factor n=1 Tax=Sphingobacterium sp. TaxID=341027 RepID=UPI00289CE260|nr:sigma-70 family RNA polymerase sigma factor [Sphingobacterium sp.]